jgi:hypothetical protein
MDCTADNSVNSRMICLGAVSVAVKSSNIGHSGFGLVVGLSTSDHKDKWLYVMFRLFNCVRMLTVLRI